MSSIPIKMCMAILCFFILCMGTKETLAAATIKFSPIGTWEITVKQQFGVAGESEQTDDSDQEKLNLSITRKGNFFLIRFVRPEPFVGPGISFPETALKARLRGNSLYAELQIEDLKHKLVISFEKSNMKLIGTYSAKSAFIVFNLEASYKITGHLSHPDMVSLLKLNRSVLEDTCNKNVSKVRNLLKAEVVSITDAVSTCRKEREELDNNNANLKISLDKRKAKIKKLKKGIKKSKTKIGNYVKKLDVSVKNFNTIKKGNVTKSKNIQKLDNKVKDLENSKANLISRLTRTSARLFALEKSLEKVVETLNEKAEKNQNLRKNFVKHERLLSEEKKQNIKFQKYIKNQKKALKEISKRYKNIIKKNINFGGLKGKMRKCVETVKSKKGRYLNAGQIDEILKHCSN